MPELVKFVNMGVANEEDVQLSLGITPGEGDWESEVKNGDLKLKKYEQFCE